MNPELYFQIYSGIVGAYGARLAAEAAQGQYETDIAQIELETTQRERDRKDRLNRALSTSIARTGASGVAMEGSPLANLKEMEEQSKLQGSREMLDARLAKMTAKTRKKMTSQALRGQSNIALAQAAVKLGASKDVQQRTTN